MEGEKGVNDLVRSSNGRQPDFTAPAPGADQRDVTGARCALPITYTSLPLLVPVEFGPAGLVILTLDFACTVLLWWLSYFTRIYSLVYTVSYEYRYVLL